MNNRTTYYIFFVALVASFAWLAVACSPRGLDKPTVTVSIQPQKYMLEQIVGDKFDVKCLLSNGANPESYDPSMTHLLNLENSKAYFRIGNVAFESAIINKVHNNNPALIIYDNSQGVSLISGTHGHGDGDDSIDPHTWTSVKNAKKIASNMYDAMVELDPDNKNYYSRNFSDFVARLDSLDKAISEKLAPMRASAFAVWHPSLSYFARDYGLEQIALSPEGKEASIPMLQAAVDKAAAHNVKVMFYQKDIDSRQALAVNEQLGAELVNINPLNYNWADEMMSIANALAASQTH